MPGESLSCKSRKDDRFSRSHQWQREARHTGADAGALAGKERTPGTTCTLTRERAVPIFLETQKEITDLTYLSQLFKKTKMEGQWNGWPDIGIQHSLPYDVSPIPSIYINGKGEKQLLSCPLVFTCTPWHACPHNRVTVIILHVKGND